ncbi:putative SNF1-activating kinase 1 [Blattamonas nauphoetae]|uniref:SNF1-activating kinase 1 n=1 Tax=Blattamonas nauphoetae TaxID=2049346 RepID=A0ABQ9XCP2_9EUKA|nr:putative SNF1-activating kinase 1 [Blattamonas nauphoetae]
MGPRASSVLPKFPSHPEPVTPGSHPYRINQQQHHNQPYTPQLPAHIPESSTDTVQSMHLDTLYPMPSAVEFDDPETSNNDDPIYTIDSTHDDPSPEPSISTALPDLFMLPAAVSQVPEGVSIPPAPPLFSLEATKVVNSRGSDGSKILNNYQLQSEIGQGSFAKVVRCEDLKTHESYALKIIRLSDLARKQTGTLPPLIALQNEIRIMRLLNHPHIIRLVEVLSDAQTNKLFLVIELAQGGAIMHMESDPVPLPFSLIRHYLRELLLGLAYMHSRGVVHRDIKPANLLVSEDGHLKISDFGSSWINPARAHQLEKHSSASVAPSDSKHPSLNSQHISASSAYQRMISPTPGATADSLTVSEFHLFTDTVGTPSFYAPEMFDGHGYYGRPCDVYAMGVTLFCLAFGVLPFQSETEAGLFEEIKKGKIDFEKAWKTRENRRRKEKRKRRLAEERRRQREAARSKHSSRSTHRSKHTQSSPSKSRRSSTEESLSSDSTSCHPLFEDLLSQMMRKDWSQRLKVEEAVAHPFTSHSFGHPISHAERKESGLCSSRKAKKMRKVKMELALKEKNQEEERKKKEEIQRMEEEERKRMEDEERKRMEEEERLKEEEKKRIHAEEEPKQEEEQENKEDNASDQNELPTITSTTPLSIPDNPPSAPSQTPTPVTIITVTPASTAVPPPTQHITLPTKFLIPPNDTTDTKTPDQQHPNTTITTDSPNLIKHFTTPDMREPDLGFMAEKMRGFLKNERMKWERLMDQKSGRKKTDRIEALTERYRENRLTSSTNDSTSSFPNARVASFHSQNSLGASTVVPLTEAAIDEKFETVENDDQDESKDQKKEDNEPDPETDTDVSSMSSVHSVNRTPLHYTISTQEQLHIFEDWKREYRTVISPFLFDKSLTSFKVEEERVNDEVQAEQMEEEWKERNNDNKVWITERGILTGVPPAPPLLTTNPQASHPFLFMNNPSGSTTPYAIRRPQRNLSVPVNVPDDPSSIPASVAMTSPRYVPGNQRSFEDFGPAVRTWRSVNEEEEKYRKGSSSRASLSNRTSPVDHGPPDTTALPTSIPSWQPPRARQLSMQFDSSSPPQSVSVMMLQPDGVYVETPQMPARNDVYGSVEASLSNRNPLSSSQRNHSAHPPMSRYANPNAYSHNQPLPNPRTTSLPPSDVPQAISRMNDRRSPRSFQLSQHSHKPPEDYSPFKNHSKPPAFEGRPIMQCDVDTLFEDKQYGQSHVYRKTPPMKKRVQFSQNERTRTQGRSKSSSLSSQSSVGLKTDEDDSSNTSEISFLAQLKDEVKNHDVRKESRRLPGKNPRSDFIKPLIPITRPRTPKRQSLSPSKDVSDHDVSSTEPASVLHYPFGGDDASETDDNCFENVMLIGSSAPAHHTNVPTHAGSIPQHSMLRPTQHVSPLESDLFIFPTTGPYQQYQHHTPYGHLMLPTTTPIQEQHENVDTKVSSFDRDGIYVVTGEKSDIKEPANSQTERFKAHLNALLNARKLVEEEDDLDSKRGSSVRPQNMRKRKRGKSRHTISSTSLEPHQKSHSVKDLQRVDKKAETDEETEPVEQTSTLQSTGLAAETLTQPSPASSIHSMSSAQETVSSYASSHFSNHSHNSHSLPQSHTDDLDSYSSDEERLRTERNTRHPPSHVQSTPHSTIEDTDSWGETGAEMEYLRELASGMTGLQIPPGMSPEAQLAASPINKASDEKRNASTMAYSVSMAGFAENVLGEDYDDDDEKQDSYGEEREEEEIPAGKWVFDKEKNQYRFVEEGEK